MIGNVIVKEPAAPAARLRSTQLKDKHTPRAPPPIPKYEIGDKVVVPEQYIGSETKRILDSGVSAGMVICGREWGEDNKLTLPGDAKWYYFLRDAHRQSMLSIIIPENKIIGLLF